MTGVVSFADYYQTFSTISIQSVVYSVANIYQVINSDIHLVVNWEWREIFLTCGGALYKAVSIVCWLCPYGCHMSFLNGSSLQIKQVVCESSIINGIGSLALETSDEVAKTMATMTTMHASHFMHLAYYFMLINDVSSSTCNYCHILGIAVNPPMLAWWPM